MLTEILVVLAALKAAFSSASSVWSFVVQFWMPIFAGIVSLAVILALAFAGTGIAKPLLVGALALVAVASFLVGRTYGSLIPSVPVKS